MSKASNEIAMVKNGGKLVPIDQYSADELMLAAKEGQGVMVTIRTPRNIRQHRLAWTLAALVADAEGLPDKEDAMDLIKRKARFVHSYVVRRTGEVIIRPKSIAFSSCSQQDFSRLFNRMIWVACHEIIPGLPEGDLRREIEDIVDGKPRKQNQQWKDAA